MNNKSKPKGKPKGKSKGKPKGKSKGKRTARGSLQSDTVIIGGKRCNRYTRKPTE